MPGTHADRSGADESDSTVRRTIKNEGFRKGRHHRRGCRRRQRPVPPRPDRLDRRAAAREERAHLRLHLARGRRHAHLQRRGEHLAVAEIHDRPLSRDRGAVRPVLRPAPERRPDAGGHAGRTRQPEADLLAGTLPRHGNRDDHARAGARAEPADRPEAFHRRAVAGGRRPLRSVRHDARVRQGGAVAGRVGRAPHARPVVGSARGRQLGRRHRQGHGPRRTRGQLRRPLGARDRPDGRHRAAGAGDGAPLPADRGHPRAEGPGEGDRQHDRLRRRDLHAPGARRRVDRHLRAARQGLVAGEHAGRLLDAAAARRVRAARAVFRGRVRALPGARSRRHPQGDQRAVHVRAGRQSAGRPGARPAQLLGRLRGDGRIQPGRRHRPRAVALDGGGRSRAGHPLDGRGALRRVRDAEVHVDQGARELRPPVPARLSE